MPDFKLDRNEFKAMTFKEADAANVFSKDIPYAERLRQAYYLISVVYGFSMNNQPTLDKTYFSTRQLSN